MTEQESHRLAVQAELDAAKSQAERNRLGQFATPSPLALDIVRYGATTLGDATPVRFLDPAIGTGAFYSALLQVYPPDRIQHAVGYEIDPHYGEPAVELWNDTPLEMKLEDFTKAEPPVATAKFNLLICNPPYVRHHHIAPEDKPRLKVVTRQACGVDINGLAGLYCYFLGLSHSWMAEGGLAGWLMPSEFMDVNYGKSVKDYLLNMVTLHHIHRFDPNEVQFGDALVSSSVVWFTKSAPPPDHLVRMSFGGTLSQPTSERMIPADALRSAPKWTLYPMQDNLAESRGPVLSDFFDIKRGLATGSNRYFILSPEEITERCLPTEAFRPILPGPRYLPADEVEADVDGKPRLNHQLFLLDFPLPENDIQKHHPTLWTYLEEGKAEGIADSYICRHRSPWYAQEHRPASPFLCTYLGRSDHTSGRPFRFILNHSDATAANVYLMMYPKGILAEAIKASEHVKRRVWEFLNSIGPSEMLNEGRVYGGGLHKLEPKELGRVPAGALWDMLSESAMQSESPQWRLLESGIPYNGEESEGRQQKRTPIS